MGGNGKASVVMTAAETRNPLLASALSYARMGWPVFPTHSVDSKGECSCGERDCNSKGKHPRTARGLTGATTDLTTVANWWTRWPSANIGVRTGRVGDRYLVALDVDPRHEGHESMADLLSIHGALPPTLRALTGGGGEHILFWSRDEIRSSVSVLGRGIDIRGEGGYIIGAESMHASGRRYVWDAGHHPEEATLAELPEWIGAALARRRPKRREDAPPPSYLHGGRNSALTSLAGSMRDRGMGVAAIEAALMLENEEKCAPPLDPKEVQRIAQSVCRYAPKNSPSSGESQNDAPYVIETASEIAQPLPPLVWICRSLKLARGGLTIAGGYGYSRKTLYAQAVGLAVAAGRDAFEVFHVEQVPVLHIDYEQGRRITRERYQRIARAQGIELTESMLSVVTFPRFKLTDREARDFVRKLLDQTKAGFVVVDSLRASISGVDENDSRIREYIDLVGQECKTVDAASMFIHHARKPGDGKLAGKYSLRGSGAIFDACDEVFVFTGEKGQPSMVEHEKDRLEGAELPSFGLSSEDMEREGDPRWGLRVIHMEGEQLRESAQMRVSTAQDAEKARRVTAVREYLRKLESGLYAGTRTDLARAVGGRYGDAMAAIASMVTSGAIREHFNGRKLVSLQLTYI